ncbi:MAG: radical SAM protein, partial [Actinomycetes bacterium]
MTIAPERTAEAASAMAAPAERIAVRMLWLDLTRNCQLSCTHCYNSSGPGGGHGTMTREDWVRVLDEAAEHGVEKVQLIGGEPTMHPHAVELAERALDLGLHVEVFSNLVHIPAQWWQLFQRDGVTVATSYYSADATQHNAVTGRSSHRLTRANIELAVRLGVTLRVGIVAIGDGQRVDEAQRELAAIGVRDVRVDRLRAFGRGARDHTPDATELCGRCGTGRAAISPTGHVSPCVFSTWM